MAALILAGAPPAAAICGNGRVIDQCSAYHYIVSPGQGTPESLQGVFWGLGGGNPAVGAGDDNGTYAPQDWLHFYQAGFCLGGAWSTDGVDGCIDDSTTPEPKRTVVALSDVDASGNVGYFALLCKEKDPSTYNYGFGAFGDVPLGPVPRPRAYGTCSVTFHTCTTHVLRPDQDLVGPNVALDPSCAGAIRAYRLYMQVVPQGSGPPPGRTPDAGWQLQGEYPIEQDASIVSECHSYTATYFAISLVFDGGFETYYLSEGARACEFTLADRPSAPKVIKTPPRSTRSRG